MAANAGTRFTRSRIRAPITEAIGPMRHAAATARRGLAAKLKDLSVKASKWTEVDLAQRKK